MVRSTQTTIAIVLTLAHTALSHAGFQSSGGAYSGGSSGGLACVLFAEGRSARPKRHGVVCGLTRRGTGCTAHTGTSLVVLFGRKNTITCARSGDLSIEGSIPGAFNLSLSGESCGAGVFEFGASGGNESPPCPYRATQKAPRLGRPPATSQTSAGKRFRRGRLRCVALTSDDLRLHDPSLGATDAVFCVRRTASEMQAVGFVFENGTERLPGCDPRVDLETGCVSATDCGLPDIPICP